MFIKLLWRSYCLIFIALCIIIIYCLFLVHCVFFVVIWIFGVLRPLSVIFQLYHGDQFTKPECNQAKTSQVVQWVRSLDLTAHTSLSSIWRAFVPGFVNWSPWYCWKWHKTPKIQIQITTKKIQRPNSLNHLGCFCLITLYIIIIYCLFLITGTLCIFCCNLNFWCFMPLQKKRFRVVQRPNSLNHPEPFFLLYVFAWLHCVLLLYIAESGIKHQKFKLQQKNTQCTCNQE
jgi:hypothetical protein